MSEPREAPTVATVTREFDAALSASLGTDDDRQALIGAVDGMLAVLKEWERERADLVALKERIGEMGATR
jgi:hypothetical protein